MHRPFRWFATYVAGLLSIPDTLLSNRFAKDEQPTIGDQS